MDGFIGMPVDRRPQALHKSLPKRDNVRPKYQGLEVNFTTQTLKIRRQIIKCEAVRKGGNSSNTIAGNDSNWIRLLVKNYLYKVSNSLVQKK
jgi:hypothetical protein